MLVDKDRYNYLKSLNGILLNKGSAILDLGCGSGKWLEQLANLGMQNLTGIDLYNEKEVNTGGKWKFISGEIFDINDDKYDVIILHHSFEHMKNPVEVLEKIYRLLDKDGVCIIRVPVMGKYAWRKYKTDWVQIDAPRHFYLYTEKAMNYLGKKTGFRLKRVVYDSNDFQFWGSDVYSRKKISLVSAGRIRATLFTDKEIARYKDLARGLNKVKDGDQAIFYFYKD
jgi:SAM-dependent methyltransferase